MREPDTAFADPRQAVLYDEFDADRSDLDAYVAIAEELDARHVLDIGCGTGSLCVRMAGAGLTVTGVDPARASLDVAKAKPNAHLVTWLHGDATHLADLSPVADLAVMTGNVAQVFVSDEDWSITLTAVRSALRPDGWLVFETRRPEARDWVNWNMAPTPVTLRDGRSAVVARTVTDVALPLVTFEGSTTVGEEVLRSASTLRFRERDEIERDLLDHGFTITDIREAPDRPGKEHVFVTQRTEA